MAAVLHLPDRVVLLDYGDVISLPQQPAARAELEALAGVPAELFWPAYSSERDALDHGTISITSYWDAVAALCGTHWDPARIAQLWSADVRSWLEVNPDMAALLEELRDGGTRLALLSNAGFDYGSPFRSAPWARAFEGVFLSAELGLLKPDPAIYLAVADRLGVAPASVVFIDNKEPNVDAAITLGMRGHVFTTAEALRAFLASLA